MTAPESMIERAARAAKSWRYCVARILIHTGLRVMPQGRAKGELYSLIDQWATHVQHTVRAALSEPEAPE